MKDKFERIIDYMRISITDRCNLRCRYCMPDDLPLSPAENILTYEEIEMICRAAVETGIHKFKITGGEPLVRRDCPDLIQRIKTIPGVEQVTMTTNGVFLGEHLSALAESGLDGVNISLDTLKPDVYQAITGQDKLPVVLANMEKAIDAGLQVKVNSVLMKGINDVEWENLADLTIARDLDVRFIEMMPIGYGKAYETVDNHELLEKLKCRYHGVTKDVNAHGNGPSVYYRIPGAKGSVGFISAIHGKFCGSCNRIRLSAQGKLKPCLCFCEAVDLRDLLRGQDAGEKLEEKIKQAIMDSVRLKPEGHCFASEDEVTEQKKMVQIGG